MDFNNIGPYVKAMNNYVNNPTTQNLLVLEAISETTREAEVKQGNPTLICAFSQEVLRVLGEKISANPPHQIVAKLQYQHDLVQKVAQINPRAYHAAPNAAHSQPQYTGYSQPRNAAPNQSPQAAPSQKAEAPKNVSVFDNLSKDDIDLVKRGIYSVAKSPEEAKVYFNQLSDPQTHKSTLSNLIAIAKENLRKAEGVLSSYSVTPNFRFLGGMGGSESYEGRDAFYDSKNSAQNARNNAEEMLFVLNRTNYKGVYNSWVNKYD